MPGRGDNNKKGTSGQGASNQSNQPFVNDDEKQKKSNHSRKQTGGKPSTPSAHSADPDAFRNEHLNKKKGPKDD